MTESPTTEEIIEGLHKLSQRTDAAYVLFNVTALEDMLERALLYQMRDLSNTLHEELFTGYGPLASFSAKIDISYALSIIDDNLVGDFRALKAIRNAFAHPREDIHFDSPQLMSKFQKLKGFKKQRNRRELFEERMAACIQHLDKHIETGIFVSVLGKRPTPKTSRDKHR